jgi:hypothetical protein
MNFDSDSDIQLKDSTGAVDVIKTRVDSFEKVVADCVHKVNNINREVLETFHKEFPKRKFENQKTVAEFFAKGYLVVLKEKLVLNIDLLTIRFVILITKLIITKQTTNLSTQLTIYLIYIEKIW